MNVMQLQLLQVIMILLMTFAVVFLIRVRALHWYATVNEAWGDGSCASMNVEGFFLALCYGELLETVFVFL